MTSPSSNPPVPDLGAPLVVLPVCANCSHLYVAHRRGRCRGHTGSRTRCGCTRFTEPVAATAVGLDRPDLDVTEDQPA
ncbi:hypothetical protein ACG83_14555 [Frankia sp. R43]|uniref:hypothetical protein n=1 Tax=Frankia sp. R43 TaxID=269536 RepID=UPI0006CA0A22|nr:hypothetical protein [Frankia sp. R43]KPM54688.1 hypothetical protein ACG83_14555 [Frankia sp. R43]